MKDTTFQLALTPADWNDEWAGDVAEPRGRNWWHVTIVRNVPAGISGPAEEFVVEGLAAVDAALRDRRFKRSTDFELSQLGDLWCDLERLGDPS